MLCLPIISSAEPIITALSESNSCAADVKQRLHNLTQKINFYTRMTYVRAHWGVEFLKQSSRGKLSKRKYNLEQSNCKLVGSGGLRAINHDFTYWRG